MTSIEKWFILYAFIGGVILWYAIANYGLPAAILIHAVINIMDLRALGSEQNQFSGANSGKIRGARSGAYLNGT